MSEKRGTVSYSCPGCKESFPKHSSLVLHSSNCLAGCLTCNIDGCLKQFNYQYLPIHQLLYHRKAKYSKDHPRCVIKNYDKLDLSAFLGRHRCRLQSTLKKALSPGNEIEFSITLLVILQNWQSRFIQSHSIALENRLEIKDAVSVLIELVTLRAEEPSAQLGEVQVQLLEMNIATKRPRREHYMRLPSSAHYKASVINVYNRDNYSFKWALIGALRKLHYGKQGKKSHCVSKYRAVDIASAQIYYCGVDLDFAGLRFPTEVRDCRTFEAMNPLISVNVFGLERENSKISGPLYRTRCEQDLHINLLFLENKRKNACHYAYIYDLSNVLLCSFACNTCIRCFEEEDLFIAHRTDKRNCANPRTLG